MSSQQIVGILGALALFIIGLMQAVALRRIFRGN